MKLRSWEFFHFFCETTNPPKNKFGLYVCGYYFLVNSQQYRPHTEQLELPTSVVPFLTHDSYLDLSVVRQLIKREIQTVSSRGIASKDLADKIKRHIASSRVLPPWQIKELLRD